MKTTHLTLITCLVFIITIFSSSAFSASIIVNTLEDDAISNDNCSLREAIEAANTDTAQDACDAGSGLDEINFGVRGLIQVTSDLPKITEQVSILGPGPDDLMVSGSIFPGADYTQAAYRLFRLSGGGNFLFRGFTIEGGLALSDAPNGEIGDGGGISVIGTPATTTLEFMRIENCFAGGAGGGMSVSSNQDVDIRWSTFNANFAQSDGGGVALTNYDGTLNVEHSTFNINETIGGSGGGIAIITAGATNNDATVNIDHSTLRGNHSAAEDGGGVFVLEQTAAGFTGTISLDIKASTIFANSADILNFNAEGGGIYLNGDGINATFESNIIAENKAGGGSTGFADVYASITNIPSITTNGYNFIGFSSPPAFPVGSPNANNDFVFSGTNPALEDFGDHGGPTHTMPPKFSSLALDQGSCTGAPYDQRGYGSIAFNSRIVDWPTANAFDGCDTGAVEHIGGGPDVGPLADYDSDSIKDEDDNCIFDANTNQSDVDEDDIGDVCDYVDNRPARYDMNNDGKADILWRNEFTGRNTVWFMDGPDRTALGLPVVGTTAWQVKGFGDTDGDGRSDILWRNITDGRNQIWKMIDGGKQTGSIATISDLNWELVGSDDFDGNGTDDILWRHMGDGRNTIYFMDGFNATSTSISSISNLDWQVAGTGDIDGDDKADIFWRNQSTGQNVVWLMDGANNSSNNLTTIADTNWTVQGIGDLNNDGLDDIVWRDAVTRAVVAWLMKSGLNESQQNISASSGSNFEIELVGDLSGDRKADIVWRDQVNGTNLLWEMDGVIKTPSSIQKVGDTNWKIMP